MATNKVYANPGAITAFLASTATIAPTGATSILWTPQNTATGHGRISAVWDRGSGAHPLRYTWHMRTQWNATAGNGDELRLYIVQADAAADPTQTDGGITFGDADTTNENPLLYNALYLGCIMSNGASHPESTSGLVYLSPTMGTWCPTFHRQSPLSTRCSRPLSICSICRACASLAGLPRICPSHSATVSQPRTSPREIFSATLAAFCRARRATSFSGVSRLQTPHSAASSGTTTSKS